MDRELSAAFKRKRRIRIYGFTLLAMATAGGSFFTFRNLITPHIDRSKITISIAEKGTIEATLPASGIVIPEYEFLLTCPINATIEKVLRRPGEPVHSGESILQLNKETAMLGYDKLLDEQQVSRNKINQLALNQEKTLSDLQTQYAIKEMRIKSLETVVEHQRELLKVGGGTEDRVKQATLDLDIANLEIRQLKTQMAGETKSMGADLDNMKLEAGMQAKSIRETAGKLKLAEVRSPGNGIVTSVSDQVGSEVREGAELARVADLSSFKVEGSIGDAYATQLRLGGPVIIRINETHLRGHIMTVEPAVKEGMVKFLVSLDQKGHALLRSNLKVDIFVVTSVKDHVVRVKNGPVFNGSASQNVFVLQGKEAVKRSVNLGESNFDYTEIRSGVRPGEQVIITELPDFAALDKFSVKN